MLFLPDLFQERFLSIFRFDDASMSARQTILADSLLLAKQHWLTGIGLGPENFQAAMAALPGAADGGDPSPHQQRLPAAAGGDGSAGPDGVFVAGGGLPDPGLPGPEESRQSSRPAIFPRLLCLSGGGGGGVSAGACLVLPPGAVPLVRPGWDVLSGGVCPAGLRGRPAEGREARRQCLRASGFPYSGSSP